MKERELKRIIQQNRIKEFENLVKTGRITYDQLLSDLYRFDEEVRVIHLVSEFGTPEILRMLIENQPYDTEKIVNLPDAHMRLPIHYAAKGGKVANMEALMSYGAHINLLDSSGKSALMYAIESGNPEAVDFVLRHMDPEIAKEPDREGMDALDYAIESGNYEIVRKIIDALKPEPREIPYEIGSSRIAGYLKRKGFKVKVKRSRKELQPLWNLSGEEILNEAIKDFASLINRSRTRDRELLKKVAIALIPRRRLLIRFLKNIPAGVKKEDRFWILEEIIEEVYGDDLLTRRPESLARLIRDAANALKVDLNHLRFGQKTLLHEEATSEDITYPPFRYRALILLMAGADPNIRDEDGNTPLHLAAKYGHLGIVKDLVRYGADINAENLSGYTPLALAIKGGNREVEEFLRQMGGKV